ncbi:cytochrome c oxidase assembly factor CtaG [Fervidibacillus halotolerans]|uniref:Cytochrome c oxidase assembly factor CtaG n=1 Tax=Fervidibacillus halotolerans TaxID=2980027 RepID=A0A9E8M1Z6_9BACI|nr:cytochrome c oxidase assembly factor CtaG [Fervidibacillus halotolerans]WAA13716.1 cytochrome c oxidase assembly factor CtaG [Fervidibacillus halotolerans]
MLRLDQFGFVALWSPYFLLFIAFVTALFFYIANRKQHWFQGAGPLELRHKILFPTAMFMIYIMKGSPIDLLSHLMFTFHMVQMAILNLLVPPILIIGVPVWMWKRIITLPVVRPLFSFFTKPLVALIGFNGVFSLYHVPAILDFIKMNIWIHGGYTSLLFIFAFFMWWPLLNRVEESRQLSGLKKMGYIFADSALITPACALIIFNPTPMYETYTNTELWIKSLELCVPTDTLSTLDLPGPEAFNLLPLNVDQQLGGVVMKILQEIIYGTVLFKVIIDWFKKEAEDDDSAPIYG